MAVDPRGNDINITLRCQAKICRASKARTDTVNIYPAFFQNDRLRRQIGFHFQFHAADTETPLGKQHDTIFQTDIHFAACGRAVCRKLEPKLGVNRQ